MDQGECARSAEVVSVPGAGMDSASGENSDGARTGAKWFANSTQSGQANRAARPANQAAAEQRESQSRLWGNPGTTRLNRSGGAGVHGMDRPG